MHQFYLFFPIVIIMHCVSPFKHTLTVLDPVYILTLPFLLFLIYPLKRLIHKNKCECEILE